LWDTAGSYGLCGWGKAFPIADQKKKAPARSGWAGKRGRGNRGNVFPEKGGWEMAILRSSLSGKRGVEREHSSPREEGRGKAHLRYFSEEREESALVGSSERKGGGLSPRECRGEDVAFFRWEKGLASLSVRKGKGGADRGNSPFGVEKRRGETVRSFGYGMTLVGKKKKK